MRVITGSARGRKLKQPSGWETRPTTDRVKESVFNIIQFQVEGRRVLDLFAGTGQMGIEALSRGAREATFVDNRMEMIKLIRENVQHCGFGDRANVVSKDALDFLTMARQQYDLIFLDPPYGKGLLQNALKLIVKFDILSEHGIILCESDASEVLPEQMATGELGRSYQYGKTKITVYQR